MFYLNCIYVWEDTKNTVGKIKELKLRGAKTKDLNARDKTSEKPDSK